jgi:DNA replication and repair protein RecF
MLIDSIILQNFRNYSFRQFEFSSNLTFFVGENGAGKTNLLEAISMLSILNGFRGAESRDLNRLQNFPFSLGFGTKHGQIGIKNMNGVKRFSFEDEPCKFAEIEGKFKVLAISPEDEFVFRSSVSVRRSFFDGLLAKINPEHEALLKEYKNLATQRSKILNEFNGQEAWLLTLEKQMAQKMVIIATNRVLLSEELSSVMKTAKGGLKGEIVLTGWLESREFSASVEEKVLQEMLYSSRTIDAITGKTLTKLERTNFDVRFLEKGVSACHSSSGEQKKMLLSAVIAVSRLANFEILLIDEVVSKLDERGKDLIFTELSGLEAQVFATGTEKLPISQISFIEI